MKLAYFSPLSPLPSGISDYSEELLPYLAPHATIDLFVDGYMPSHSFIKTNFKVFNYKNYHQLSGRYCLPLYHMSNYYRFHRYIYDTLLKEPGVVVLHECFLEGFYKRLTLAQGRYGQFEAVMEACYGPLGKERARASFATPDGLPLFPMLREVILASKGIIVHSDYARAVVLSEEPTCKVVKINHHYAGFRPIDEAERARLRGKHGVGVDKLVVGSFGFLTSSKRLNQALRAFKRLKAQIPHALFLLVGFTSWRLSPKALIKQLNLEDSVLLKGYVSKEEFFELLAITDLTVNLRYPTFGETSGSLIRLMGMGKPVIVSNYAQFAELPDACCLKVSLGQDEEEKLLKAMLLLARDEGLRQEIGRNAYDYIHETHSLDASSRTYLDFLEEAASKGGSSFRTGITKRKEVREPLHRRLRWLLAYWLGKVRGLSMAQILAYLRMRLKKRTHPCA